MNNLFDLIVEQILSGVRSDGRRIDFRSGTSNDKVKTLSEMRRNFTEAVDKHKNVFRNNKRKTEGEYLEAIGEIMATIPTFSDCIHQDDTSYFENVISDYIQVATMGGVPLVQNSPASEYNIFVKDTLKSLRITHPTFSHRERFIAMSEAWTAKHRPTTHSDEN